MAAKPTLTRSLLKEADIKRCVKGVVSGGVKVSRVEIENTKIVIYSDHVPAKDAPNFSLDMWRANQHAD
jgi:hypothetical protein